MSRGGVVEGVLSVLAAPLTGFTVLLLGYLLVRARRSRRDVSMKRLNTLAVPLCAMLLAIHVALSKDVALLWWWGLGSTFGAW